MAIDLRILCGTILGLGSGREFNWGQSPSCVVVMDVVVDVVVDVVDAGAAILIQFAKADYDRLRKEPGK